MASPADASHGSLSPSAIFLSPNGRITQAQYWMGVAVIFAGNVIVNFVGPIGLLLWGFLVFSGFCVYGKRLHDSGKSAKVHAIAWIVIIIMGIGAFILSWDGFVQIGRFFDQSIELTDQDYEALRQIFTEDASAAGMYVFTPEGLSKIFLWEGILPLTLTFFANLLIWLFYTIWLGAQTSQKFDNRYGKGPSGDAF